MAKVIQKQADLELIYGTHPVFEVLQQKRRKVFELFVLESDHATLKKIQTLLPKHPVTIHKMKRETLTLKLGTTDHQGLGALVQPFAFRKKFFEKEKSPFLLLLDGVQDVRNLGAIIRSAYCTGVDGVIICKKKSATITATALKASAGLAERMEIYQAPSIESVLIELKNAGYALYVAALSKQENAFTVDYKMPLCLVIGSEGSGVSNTTLKAGTIVTLPQKSAEVSYNASVAAGILMSLIAFGKK
jgi:23S rRNA (guanosine2251-2'-O)-methyltransferase